MENNWLHISPSSGMGNTQMTISANTNGTGAVRKAKIIITAGTLTREISVIQYPADGDITCTYVVGENSSLQLLNYVDSRDFLYKPDYAYIYNDNGDFLGVTSNQIALNEVIDLSSLNVVEGDVVTVVFYTIHSGLLHIDYFNNVRLKTISFGRYNDIAGLFIHLPYLEVIDIPSTYVGSGGPVHCIDCPRLSAFTGDNPLIQSSRELLLRYTYNNVTVDMLAGVALYGIEEYEVPSNITEIYQSCFAYTPNNVQTVKSIVFNQPEITFNLYGLRDQPDTHMGMFQNIASLTSVTLPNVVKTGRFTNWYVPAIGYKMFYGCTGLTSVNIPISGFTNGIQYGMFYNCSSLKQLTIPSGITSIESAFSGCTSLTSITVDRTTAATVSNTTFQGIATGGTLTFPEGSDYSQWLSSDQYYLGYYLWTDGIPFNLENVSAYYLQYQGNVSGSGASQSVFITANKPEYQVIASDVQNTTGSGVTWITVSGTPNNGRVEFKIYPTTTAETQRNCWLQVVYSGEIYASITVSQLAASQTAVTPTILVSSSQLSFAYDAWGSSSGQDVTVNSNVVYSYSATTNWITVSGTPNSGTTTLKIYPNSTNTGSSSRSGDVLIRYNDTTYQTITVTQSSVNSVTISANPLVLSFDYNASGSSIGQNISVNSNVVYSYSATTDWITVSGTPNSGTTTLKIYPNSTNTGSTTRNGEVLIRYNDTTYQSIFITQMVSGVTFEIIGSCRNGEVYYNNIDGYDSGTEIISINSSIPFYLWPANVDRGDVTFTPSMTSGSYTYFSAGTTNITVSHGQGTQGYVRSLVYFEVSGVPDVSLIIFQQLGNVTTGKYISAATTSFTVTNEGGTFTTPFGANVNTWSQYNNMFFYDVLADRMSGSLTFSVHPNTTGQSRVGVLTVYMRTCDSPGEWDTPNTLFIEVHQSA